MNSPLMIKSIFIKSYAYSYTTEYVENMFPVQFGARGKVRTSLKLTQG